MPATRIPTAIARSVTISPAQATRPIRYDGAITPLPLAAGQFDDRPIGGSDTRLSLQPGDRASTPAGIPARLAASASPATRVTHAASRSACANRVGSSAAQAKHVPTATLARTRAHSAGGTRPGWSWLAATIRSQLARNSGGAVK